MVHAFPQPWSQIMFVSIHDRWKHLDREQSNNTNPREKGVWHQRLHFISCYRWSFRQILHLHAGWELRGQQYFILCYIARTYMVWLWQDTAAETNTFNVILTPTQSTVVDPEGREQFTPKLGITCLILWCCVAGIGIIDCLSDILFYCMSHTSSFRMMLKGQQ